MKRQYCTQCGAALNSKNKCEFCGSGYEAISNNATDTRQVVRLSDEEIGGVLKQIQPAKFMALPIIVFAFVWCGAALGGAIATFSAAGLFGLMPLGMFLVGIIMFSFFISAALKGGTKKVLMLWQEKRYDEAFSLCEAGKDDNHKIVWAFIAFHRYLRDDDAHKKLLLVSNNALHYASARSTAIAQLLKYLGITTTPPSSSSSSSSGSIKINMGGGHRK